MKKQDEILNIWDELLYPFAKITSLEIESASQAKTAIQELKQQLDPKQQWDVRNDALEKSVKYLKGSIYYYPKGDFKDLIPEISKATVDIRTMIVRNACILIGTLAQVIGEDFQSQFLQYLPNLTKQINNNSLTISSLAHLTILKASIYCTTKSFAKTIFQYAQNPSYRFRQIAAEFCYIVIEMWPITVINTFRKELESNILLLTKDSDAPTQSVAVAAKELFSSLPSSSPKAKKNKNPVTTLQPQSFDRKKRTSVPNSPSSPRVMIDLSKPLQADLKLEDANKFVEQFADIIAKGSWVTISGKENQAVTAIVCVAKPLKAANSLKKLRSILPSIFKQLHDFFQPKVFDLFISVDFDSEIMIESAKHFSFQEIAESFKKPLKYNHLKFYAAVFDLAIPISLTSTISFGIQKLIEDNPTKEETKTLKRFLENSESAVTLSFPYEDIESAIKSVLQILSGKYHRKIYRNNDKSKKETDNDAYDDYEEEEEDFEEEEEDDNISEISHETVTSRRPIKYKQIADKLLKKFHGTPEDVYIIDRDLIPGLNNLIKERPEVVISFINAIIDKNADISFSDCIPKLLHLSLENSIKCVARLANNIKAMASLITCIQKEPSPAIEALKLYGITAPPQKLVPLIKIIPDFLMDFIDNENEVLRRNAYCVLGLFQKKVPKPFSKKLKKFTQTQQHMIKLYSKKKF